MTNIYKLLFLINLNRNSSENDELSYENYKKDTVKNNNNKEFNFLNDTEFTMTDSINTIKEKLEKEEEKIDLMIDILIKKEFENYQLFKENPNEKHNLIQEHRNLYIKIHSKSKEVLEKLFKYIDLHKKDMGKYVLGNNKETKLYSNMKNYLMENVCKVYNENINDNLPDILNIDNIKNRIFTVNKKEMYDVIDFIEKFFSKRLLNSEDILEDLQVSKDLVLDSINIKDKNFFYKIIDNIKQIFFKNRIDTEELQKISKEKLAELMIQYNKEVILLTDNIKPINIDLFKKKELEINENFEKLMNNNIKNNIPMMKNFFIKLVDGIKKKEELREKDKGYLNIYDEEQQKWENFALGNYLEEREEIINYIKKSIEIIDAYNKKLLIKNEENNLINQFKKTINLKLKPELFLFSETNLDFFIEHSKENITNEINKATENNNIIKNLDKYENILLKEDFKTLDKKIRDLIEIIDNKLDKVKQKDKNLQNSLKNMREKYLAYTKKNQIKVNEKNIYNEN